MDIKIRLSLSLLWGRPEKAPLIKETLHILVWANPPAWAAIHLAAGSSGVVLHFIFPFGVISLHTNDVVASIHLPF